MDAKTPKNDREIKGVKHMPQEGKWVGYDQRTSNSAIWFFAIFMVDHFTLNLVLNNIISLISLTCKDGLI